MDPGEKLVLEGSCRDCYGRIKFEWGLLKYNSLTADENNASTNELIPREQFENMLFTPLQSLNVAIKPNQLAANTKYSLRIRGYRSPSVYGESLYVFITNHPPVNGNNMHINNCYNI